jgi:hypothetical protein
MIIKKLTVYANVLGNVHQIDFSGSSLTFDVSDELAILDDDETIAIFAKGSWSYCQATARAEEAQEAE